MRNNKVKVFYTPKQVLHQNINQSYSKSPLKPMLLMQNFEKLGIDKFLDVNGDFLPFNREDFLVAHTPEYVDAVLTGNDLSLRSSNSLPWSPELAETVRYTNSSLYNAIKYSIEHPETPCFSPTSGFHHAHPHGGAGFCTFAGQVIASVKLYREKGMKGAYFDLDGHFGNSIEDARDFVDDINIAVPRIFNINPEGHNKGYYEYLLNAFVLVEDAIMKGDVNYVVWCHGADSHIMDDLGGRVNTEYWVKCAEAFYAWVKSVDEKLANAGLPPLPVTMSLFGGYRKDSYESVLSLHTKDMVLCLNSLCGQSIAYEAQVVDKFRGGFAAGWSGANWSRQQLPVRLSPNEAKLLEFMEDIGDEQFYSGLKLGLLVKNWKNHSMGKWAKKLVRRGKLEGSPAKGYRLKMEREN